MARITPIDVVKGIHGKYGSGSNDYFATNRSSNRIHLAKYLNKPTGPLTEGQRTQMEKFGEQQKAAAAWLRANRPNPDVKGDKGSVAYQQAQALKKTMHLSNVREIVLKYMDEDGNVTLPVTGASGANPSNPSTPSNPSNESFDGLYMLSLMSNDEDLGSVTNKRNGLYAPGSRIDISATPSEGAHFVRWSDGDTNETRTLTMNRNYNLVAYFE